MSTTTHVFKYPCPLSSPYNTHTEELGSPSLTLQVVKVPSYPQRHDHANHVYYTNGTEYPALRECDLSVPADRFMMTILWRPDTTEHIVVAGGSSTRSASVEPGIGKTTITFDVPTWTEGDVTWHVSNGDPGFDLKVTVRRKA